MVASSSPREFTFAPDTTPAIKQVALSAIAFGSALAENVQQIKLHGLEAGYRFKAYEEAAGKNELLRLLKHHFPADLVRYFRNLVAQAKLVDQYPNLYELIVNAPACLAAALLSGTEEQVEEILTDIAAGTGAVKWTIKLIKGKIAASTPDDVAIAPGAPVEILEGEYKGFAAIVAAISEVSDEVSTVSVLLADGQQADLPRAEVRGLDGDIFSQLVQVLNLTDRLHGEFKAACDAGDDSRQKELEAKIAKLNKCRLRLGGKLSLTEQAVSELAKNHLQVEGTGEALDVFDIPEAARDAIQAKAAIASRLNPGLPANEYLLLAIADYLFPPAKKSGSIPMAAKDVSDLQDLLVRQHEEIHRLRSELDERADTVQAPPPPPTISPDRERELLAKIVELQQQVEQLQSAANSPAVEPHLRQPQENDVVRVKAHRIAANVGKIGRFLGLEKQDNGLAEWIEAKILIDEGGKYPMPIFVKDWQADLEPVNLSAAELVEINRSRSIAAEHADQSEMLERLRVRVAQAKQWEAEIENLKQHALRAAELERENERLRQVSSGSAIAAELGKSLTSVLGRDAVEELARAGEKGVRGIARFFERQILARESLAPSF